MSKNWLKHKGEILLKYADSLPTKQDRIKLTFDYPEAGWMPVHFLKNEEHMGFIEFSDVYDAFVPLREWLETIAEIGNDHASIINLDCERWHVVLSYEPVWYYDYEKYKNSIYPPNYGIFTVYDECDDKFILDAFCKTETFLRDVYKCIIDFVKAMKEKPEFIEDWIADSFNEEWGSLDDDDPAMNEIFMSKMKSKKIMDYIRSLDAGHKNRNHFKRLERKRLKKQQELANKTQKISQNNTQGG